MIMKLVWDLDFSYTHFVPSLETGRTHLWCFNQESGWGDPRAGGGDLGSGHPKVTSRTLVRFLDGMLTTQVGSVCEKL